MTDKEKTWLQETISKLLKSGKYELERDGWTQYEPDFFIKLGFPQSFIDPLISTFVSDGTWKGSLWKDEDKGLIAINQIRNEAQKLTKEQLENGEWLQYIDQDVVRRFEEVYIHESKGVSYLTFLRALTKLFELKTEYYNGRGFQAGEYIRKIHEHLGINKDDFGQVVIKE